MVMVVWVALVAPEGLAVKVEDPVAALAAGLEEVEVEAGV